MEQHPFQCIAILRKRYFLAACGPRLTVVDLDTYDVTSQFTPEPDEPNEPIDLTEDQEEPYAKKQKYHGKGKGQGRATEQEQQQRQQQQQQQPPAKKQKLKQFAKGPSIIELAVSSTGLTDTVVAITEDKSLYVFIHRHGHLDVKSRRVMPKRPCAVQILPDNATILVGDKFGDVYSLPLHDLNMEHTCTRPPVEPEFKPSADLTTIHSKRNREVLAAQLKQTTFTKKKDPVTFKHKHLIGHTSMLTDLQYMREAKTPQRGYIVTADRDEHIRVSRAPQPHVIEGYCQGHKEFVSKICQIGASPVMISGGGDEWLGVWDWTTCKLKHKLPIRDIIPDAGEKTSVSGMWCIEVKVGLLTEPVVVVTLERVRALIFAWHTVLGRGNADDATTSRMCYMQVPLQHAPIDVVWARENQGYNLIVSLDNRHKGGDKFAFFNVTRRTDGSGKLSVARKPYEKDVLAETIYASHESIPVELDGSRTMHAQLDALLYTVSGLRKQRGAANGEGAQDYLTPRPRSVVQHEPKLLEGDLDEEE